MFIQSLQALNSDLQEHAFNASRLKLAFPRSMIACNMGEDAHLRTMCIKM